MAEFSEIVYKGKGLHQRPGGTYDYIGVKSQEELDEKLANGWYKTMPEAINAEDGIPNAAVKKVDKQNAPPTRSEMDQKAKQLGIKVDGRWSDAKLATEIANALKT